jgi:hypothetical protein
MWYKIQSFIGKSIIFFTECIIKIFIKDGIIVPNSNFSWISNIEQNFDKIQEELRQEFGHNLVVTSEDKNLFTQLTTLKKENITFKYSCFFIEDYPFTKITFKIN